MGDFVKLFMATYVWQ